MTRKEFRKYFDKGIVILDGATGTQLHKRGMPADACPEKWAAENPEALIAVQRSYVESSTHILYTFSMGGNAISLRIRPKVPDQEVNRRLAQLSRRAAPGKALVAEDIILRHLLEPCGEITFEQSVEATRSRSGPSWGGVDCH